LKQPGVTYPKFYLYNRIVKAKLFIDTNYQEDIDLANIAEEACFSKFHFIRLFKSIYGNTPHQYLVKVRTEKAKFLLEQNHSVSEACFMVGFDSVTSFAALFKRSEGMPPSEYQQAYLKRQERIRKVPLAFIPNCFTQGCTKTAIFER
jgi:AraC-like DNA-binding protein